MNRWVVDTNVMVVANGRHDGNRPVSPKCRKASIEFLMKLLEGEQRVLLDCAGAVFNEYNNNLNLSGQPGVGDRFFQVLHNNVESIQRVDLQVCKDGEYSDLHPDIVSSGFDRSDRKFVALARKENAPVANSVDSDWLNDLELLTKCGVEVKFVCGKCKA